MDLIGHYPREVSGYPGSFSLLSNANEVDTAVVFVHGFWGDSQSTWQQFPFLIDFYANEHPWWDKADAHFYQYNGSGTTPIAVSADRFFGFLDGLFPRPNPAVFLQSSEGRGTQRGPDFRYKHLVLVGHSEGCVIIRRAIVTQYKLIRSSLAAGSRRLSRDYGLDQARRPSPGEEFLQNFPIFGSNVVLFAPAHLGASITGWRGVLLSLLRTRKVMGALVDSLTAYDELKKDSPVLKQLQADTELFARQANYCLAFVAQSYFGARDRIVYIGEYNTDPPAKLVENANHTSICKPSALYREPLKYVYDGPVRRKSAP